MISNRVVSLGLAVLTLTHVADAQRAPDVCAAARSAKAAGPTHGDVTPAEVCRVLSALAHDSMEGRATGSVGGARAARFIAAEMKAAGLEPGGDSGYFQRVPLVFASASRSSESSVPSSFAERDTFPAERRGLAVNVIGILRGSDPILKDSVVLVDAHYDHLGVRSEGPVDIDSIRVVAKLAAAIDAERMQWLDRSGVMARAAAAGGRPQLSAEERAKLQSFDERTAALRVNMDSIRRAHPTPRRDSIYNGADDDAAGTVAVIEIARHLAKGPRPKRTIIFAATTGEEVGLFGTRWYLEHPTLPLKAMQANLEIEMIGRPDSLAGGPGRAWMTGFERSTMGESFAAAGLPIGPDKRLEQQFFMRSDNIAFARMGIPAHTLSTYNMHTDYHQVTDETSAVDFAHMAGVINVGVKAVEILANGRAPSWKPGGQPPSGPAQP